MIDFLPTDHVIGFWFVPGDEKDWMACIWIRGEELQGTYRFRYYDPEDPGNDAFSGQDRKSWHSLKAKKEQQEKLVESMHDLAKLVSEHHGEPVYWVPVNDTGEKAVEVLTAQPWCHVKKVESAKDLSDSGEFDA